MPQHLRIPQGTESFYLDEAYAHQRLLRAFEDTCHGWAYLPVTTPVYDYHDAYRSVLSDEHESLSLRLIDRTGDLLILRPDVTLFLARQMGLVLQEDDLPVRVYYGDTILRHEDPNHPSKEEHFQVGAELIGLQGHDAEAEMVLLLFDALDAWKTSDVVVHLGHRGLIAELNTEGDLAGAISKREWSSVRSILDRGDAGTSRVRELAQLFRFIGTAEELHARVRELREVSTGEREALSQLLALAGEAEALGYGDRLRIDLSEVGTQSYHTGVVFQAYAQGVSAPVASGGRYDGLLGSFGFNAPSVGFSVMLRRVQRLSSGVDRSERAVTRATGAGFRERARAARQARKEGKVVEL